MHRYCTVPYRTVPCCIVPYHNAPHRTAPYRTVPYCTIARSLHRSVVWSLVCSAARSHDRSVAPSFSRLVAGSLGRSVARSLGRSIAQSFGRWFSGGLYKRREHYKLRWPLRLEIWTSTSMRARQPRLHTTTKKHNYIFPSPTDELSRHNM